MRKYNLEIILSFVILLIASIGFGQDYRSISGEGNNLNHPTWGTKFSDVERLVPVAFEDRISNPAAPTRPNPRMISNRVFDQKQNIGSTYKYSDFVWVFGQFLDHDLTLIPSNANEPYSIDVPACDEMFDPNCDGYGRIPLNRSKIKPGSGTSVDNPRSYLNEVTAFLDGSAIYGSDDERATWLRSFNDGKLKMTDNGLMPFNTIDGTFNSNIDFSAPHMDNENRYTTKVFVAGDARANENVNLSVMHTLFVREHNRICDELKLKNPNYSDEIIYQEARKINIAQLQAITYYEWLPTIGIDLGEYPGYDSEVNPNILLTFSAAAYRMGHTLVNSRILRMDDQCNAMAGGDLELKDAYFNPRLLDSEESISPFLKGMSYQIQQELDCQLRPDIRNFLFGPPEAGMGMDLAAINIQRAREMGLPDFNTIREVFGLEKYESFDQICPDPNVYQTLEELYSDINNVDPWVGMLGEQHVPGAMFGATVLEILKTQFSNVRLGDRYYFENDPSFTFDEIERLKSTKLKDIVIRNTDLKLMQENVFKATPECLFSGIDLSGADLNMYAFPNPTSDYYNLGVYALDGRTVDYLIYDASGKMIDKQQLELDKGMNTFSMTLGKEYTPGVYTLVVAKGGYSKSIKIQKL